MQSHGKYNRMVYFAYNVLLALALLLSAPWWLLEMLQHGKYRSSWRERFGVVPERLGSGPEQETIWIHAVSVGEVLAISRVVEELKVRLPGWRVVVSTTTDTGQRLARERFGESNVFYFPLDFSRAVQAYLDALRPRILVLAESEFWPNLLRLAQKAGVRVAVVNARVSDRSLPRYLRFRTLLRPVMRDVDLYLAQSRSDAERLIEIGAPAERVHVGGNLKFEVKLPDRSQFAENFAEALEGGGIGPVIVAGSTLEGEESSMVVCFEAVVERYHNALLVLAPRHPERFEFVAAMLRWWQTRECPSMSWVRRSQWDGETFPRGGIFLLDSIGELAGLYQFADLAFIGGSLYPHGGHNILEAAQYGVPILVGPHTENFREIVRTFQQAEALRVVTLETLTTTVLELLDDSEQRKRLGQLGLDVIHMQQGTLARTVDALFSLMAVQPKVHTTGTRV